MIFWNFFFITFFLFNNALNTFYLRLEIVRDETRCRHMGYSFRLTARVLLYAPSHRQDSTYHGLCYTGHGALAGTGHHIPWPFIWNDLRQVYCQLIQIRLLCIDCSKYSTFRSIFSEFHKGFMTFNLIWHL